MAHSSLRPDIFRCRRFSKSGTQVRFTDGDINRWIKKIEIGSEFVVSEAFSCQKPHISHVAVALESTEQLQDHDDAYSEAQYILSEWMNTKLHPELKIDEEEEEEERVERHHVNLNYRRFHDMNSQLVATDESFEGRHFLWDLMQTDVINCEIVQGLCRDMDIKKKRGCDPSVTMEIRHKQVKERRAERNAVCERQRREKKDLMVALEEAKRLEMEKLRRRKKEAQRQEELLQQEVVRLRREMQDKRSIKEQARKREREKCKKQEIIAKPDLVTPTQPCKKEQEAETNGHILNLQCIHKHFSAWYSVVLDKNLQLGKAAALSEWRTQLRVWRAWRLLVWIRKKEKEAERTEEELRKENRYHQLAEESNRRRLLRRCLSDWSLWCRMEREQRELFNQQEETRQKMAALIDAAASGKLKKNCTEPSITVQPECVKQTENITLSAPVQRATSAPPLSTWADRKPTLAWQVTRRHVALSIAEAQEGQRLGGTPRCHSADMHGGRFQHRHIAQQRTIAEQKRLLKEQQDIINELQEKQNLLEVGQKVEKVERLAAQLEPPAFKSAIKPSRSSKEVLGEIGITHPLPKENACRLVSRHPAVRAMEERARQRAERRKEIENMKRQREEEKLAQMREEEEEKLRREEEEKSLASERRRKEKKIKKEKELEKQRKTELGLKLFQQAKEHYNRSLLLKRGITPWRRLVIQSHANAQKAVAHHAQVLQRCYFLFWLHTSVEAVAEKIRRAEKLYECILLRRTLHSWKMIKPLQSFLIEQAEHFCMTQTQRKVLKALLDHAIQQRLEAWDREQQADEYNAKQVVTRCFAAWRQLPDMLQEEREREERRDRLRRKVAEILPDFRSSPGDIVWSLGSPV